MSRVDSLIERLESMTGIIAYIEIKMIEQWEPELKELLRNFKRSSSDFSYANVQTVPKRDLAFMNSSPPCKRWTFTFLYLKKFPDTLFYFFSDADQGVYEVFKDKYFVNNSTRTILGENQIPEDEEYFCEIKNDSYLELDWE